MDIYKQEAESVDVGERLRELREERDLSIRAVGRLSGLSANALSVIERGKSSPSVSTLYKIADALEVPVTAFFQEKRAQHEVVVIKASQRNRIPFHRGVWEDLGGEQFSGKVEPFMLTLEVGASSGRFPINHTGHELVFCLRGQLEYEVEGETYLLEAGDCLLFSAALNHEWRNPGKTVTNALFVISCFQENERPSRYHRASSEKREDEEGEDDEKPSS
ncbi:MAG: helix-turn-helix domain-containing protein [Anaerolineales bacterium]|nr:helix-turn-helix domain-containing protein [Anaerolineales bacterium]MBS3752451.1 helix-turn-helix domain-containing protein [Anaerolineales bacterium]